MKLSLIAPKQLRRMDSGFTLLEILLAIFIFAILVTSLFSSYRTLTRQMDNLEGATDDYEIMKNCISRIVSDLEALHISEPPKYEKPKTGDDPDYYRFEGDTQFVGGDSYPFLRFTAFAHLPLTIDDTKINQRDGVAEIIYYVMKVKVDDAEQLVLKRADHLEPYPEFDQNAEDPTLLERLKSMEIVYLDGENNESDRWDSEKAEYDYATPKGLKIAFEIFAKKLPEKGFFYQTDQIPTLTFETYVVFPRRRLPMD